MTLFFILLILIAARIAWGFHLWGRAIDDASAYNRHMLEDTNAWQDLDVAASYAGIPSAGDGITTLRDWEILLSLTKLTYVKLFPVQAELAKKEFPQ